MNSHSIRLRRRLPVLGSVLAGAFSTLGNAVAMVALPWFVLTLTGSPLWTGIAAAAGVLPMIAGSLFGGGLVDRFGPRWIAFTGDFTSALAVAAVPLLYHLDMLGIGTLVVLIAIGAAMDGPASIAAESRHPELARLAGFRLERIKAADELIENAGVLIGPALAGVMIALVGVEDTLWLTAGCSLAAAILDVISLPTRRNSVAKEEVAVGLAGAWEAVRFLLRDPLLRSLITLGTLFGIIFGAMEAVVMPAFFKATGQSAMSLGLFLSATGGGAIVGTLAYAAWGHRLSGRGILIVGCAVEALAIFVLALAPPVSILIAAGAVAGLATGPIGPIVATAALRRVPVKLRGRVLGAADALELSAIPLAIILAGGAVEIFGAQRLLFGCAAALAATTVLAVFLPGLRQLDMRRIGNVASSPVSDDVLGARD
nr:MFS transporter [Ensifer oleiphilus]